MTAARSAHPTHSTRSARTRTAQIARVLATAVVAASLVGCALLPEPQSRREVVTTPPLPVGPPGVEGEPLGVVIPPLPQPLTPELLALLPEARYDAVIPGLEPYESAMVPEPSYDTYRLTGDTAVYDDERVIPVAWLSATDFLARPTVVVPVELQPGWAKVLTPARQALPSENGGIAPAQTAGWVPIDALTSRESANRRVIISLSKQTLTIQQSAIPPNTWDIGIGTPGTPTPSGVTGYLQARYLDPRQGQSEYPIQLTSLHATTSDEPYRGGKGGLIALHFAEKSSGAVSHGCLRLDASAIRAVDSLPLGTAITILP